MDEQSIGNFVRQRRRELDLTQDELARRVGCAAITIRKIEADDARPSVQIAERVAMALAIPLDQRANFVRRARIVRPEPEELPTPAPRLDEIGSADLTGRAIRGYALAERIGSGGMGAVYRAVQPVVEGEVAIKIILPSFANHPDFIRRFETEAQLVARLEHPHIVPLYDYWREPGVAFLVMRLLRGGNLQGLLRERPLPIQTVVHLVEQICQALHAAHRIGIIHRDLKPANILLDEDQNAYLADFGIAKNLGNPDSGNQTELGMMMVGSPNYMSPEQIQTLPVSPQTDIYCLGVMLYEMLTGKVPFIGPTPFELIQQHLTAPMPPLAAYTPNLPAALDMVIARATAKNAEDRYDTALVFLNGFQQAISETTFFHPVFIAEEESLSADLINPYKGLRAFNETDAEDFFGRETLVQQFLARLSEGGELTRFLAVIGPSGSGKSSVVKAGLVPVLRRGGLLGAENWFYVDMLPGPHPFEELEAALLRVAINPPPSLLDQLKSGDRGLGRAVNRILPSDPAVELVLVIDQFEELFTLTDSEEEQALFLNNLVRACLDERSRLHVIITLRADFIDRPLRYVDFGELIQRRNELVLPLTPDELERAIQGPARRVGLKLESGLTSAMIRDVGDQPGALPLLQFALTELFELRKGNLATKEAYQAIGGVLGALGRRAEDVFTHLSEDEQVLARQMFLRLVTLGEGNEDTRRRVLRAEIESLEHQQIGHVLDLFGTARLLAFDRDPLTRGATLEVAHEALLREWARYREWLNDSRSDVRMQRQLALGASEWLDARSDASFLLVGSHLEQFQIWAEGTTVALTKNERAYLEMSSAEWERRKIEEQRRQHRELETAQKLLETERQSVLRMRMRNRVITIVGIIALFLAVLAGAFSFQAEKERKLAFSRELAAAALNNKQIDPERAALLALQAVSFAETNEALTALHRTIPALHLVRSFNRNTTIMNSVAVSPDGKYIASASLDTTVTIWDAQSGQTIHVLSGHTASVNSVVFSPDGQTLASASWDGSLKIWDAATGLARMTLSGHTGGANTVAFSPDGKLLVSGGSDAFVRVWDSANGDLLATLTSHDNVGSILFPGQASGVSGVAFASKGLNRRLASAGFDGKIILWDLTSLSQPERILTIPTGEINALAFSPDGNRLVTGRLNGNVEVWDTTPGPTLGKNILTINDEQTVYSVAFSSGGTRMAASDGEKTIILDAASGQRLVTLWTSGQQVVFTPNEKYLVVASNIMQMWDSGPDRELLTLTCPGGAASVLFSKDGKRLFTGCIDGTILFWDSATGQALLTLHEHTNNVVNLALSPDGTQLATASWDGTAEVLDSETGKVITTIIGHTDQVWGVAFSPDGKHLATGSFDGTARVWDIATGQELLSVQHAAKITNVAFSPDGKRLATAAWESPAVYIWDAVSGQKLSALDMPGGVDSLVFSPDGQRLAVSAQTVDPTIWDVRYPEARVVFRLKGHFGNVMKIMFSPDGSQLATAGWEGQTKLWDAATGRELLTLADQKAQLLNLAFSPDGAYLATAGMDGLTQVYVLRLKDLLSMAKSRLTRSFTLEECQRFLHMDACP